MKFQCQNCQGVVETDFDDEYVSCGHCSSVCHVPKTVEAGVVIDDFAILHLLGQGGMGTVYLAHQFSLDRKVALKILKQDISLNEKFKNDFIKEARSVASLNHPKIVQAFKVGEEDGKLFFAMECIEGDNLQDMLKAEGALDELMVLRAARDVIEALGYAWDNRKLVHRDIKPENIMLGLDGSCKVMDLGLSCNAGDFEDDGDTISGTPQYISPEQILGQEIDNRSDFYCLGATLYHLLSGRQPFDGDLKEMIRKHIQESPLSLKKMRPELSGNTVKIVHKLMNKNPQDRYLSTIELLKDIDLAIKYVVDTRRGKKHFSLKTDTSGLKSSATTSTQSIRRPKKKSSTVPIVIGSMAALLLMTFLIVYMITRGATNQPLELATVQAEQEVAPVYVKTPTSVVKDKGESLTKGLLPGLNYKIFKKHYKQAGDLYKETLKNFTGNISRPTTIGLKTRNENFGCIFSGYINIPFSETYQFSLSVDDRCLVYIDGKKVVGAVYPAKEKGNVILDKGLHKIEVYYVQEKGFKSLDIKVSSVSVDEKKLPTEWLFRDSVSIEK